ncbi:hypothetical protein [Nonomuraea roseola]|uniref:Amidohydrolase 3 domain-containing protein n=1 Tax=Nonomuraea roseola TaxID=46179 RepID=A0ABV5Q444_9ACTN
MSIVVRNGRASLAEGDEADLMVIDDNPFEGRALRSMPVTATMLAGRWTWRKGI